MLTETGLFLLEGNLGDFGLTITDADNVVKRREGYEFNNGKVFAQPNAGFYGPCFFNKIEGYVHSENEAAYLAEEALGDFGAFKVMDTSVVHNIKTTKLASKKYQNEFVAFLPVGRAVRTILREEGVEKKRTLLFLTGIPTDKGGKTWIVAPTGFPGRANGGNAIISPGGATDLNDLRRRSSEDLWAVITNAVPIISGHNHRAPDEKYPRILHMDLDDSKLDDIYKAYLECMRDGTASLTFATSFAIQSRESFKKAVGAAAVAKQEIFTGLEDQLVDVEDGMW